VKRKLFLVLAVIALSGLLLADYNIGDTVADYSWTDNTGTAHSIYELTAQGIVPVLFWGGTG
jgi:hypothetical protein